MKIHFLWWEGCPSHPKAWKRLQRVIQELNLQPTIERIEITDDESAEKWRFPGSPTILVNGEDIDPAPPDMYRLTCRLYRKDDGRPTPVPTESLIRRALLRAAEQDAAGDANRNNPSGEEYV